MRRNSARTYLWGNSPVSSILLTIVVLWNHFLSTGLANVAQEAGQDATLSCDYSFSGVRYTLEWFRGSQRLLNFFSDDASPTYDSTDLSGRLSLESGRNLAISTLQRTDDGTYYCHVSEVGGNPADQGSNQNLTVTVPPVIGLSPQSPVSAKKGDNITLACTVTDSKPGATISFSGPATNGTATSGTIVVTEAKLSDGGNYTCTANNTYHVTVAMLELAMSGGTSADASVLTIAALAICQLVWPSAAQIYQEVGQGVTLTCDYTFSGNRYTIEWHRGDERLLNFFSQDDNPVFDSTDLSGRLRLQDGKNLVVSNLRRTDDGRFYCKVTEIGGNPAADGSDQNLVVTVSPTITLSPSEQSTAATGSDVTLTCTVDSKPDANITWTGPNGDLGTGNSVMLNNVQPANDTGTYTCTATNSFSTRKSASGSVVLTVQDMTTAMSTPARQSESTVDSNRLASTGGLSTGAQAGLGVGIALACIIGAGVLAYFFVVRKKRAGREKDDGVESGDDAVTYHSPGHPGAPENLSRPPPNEPEVMYAELDLKNAPAGSRRPYVATPDDSPTEYAQIRPDKPPRSSVPHTLAPDDKTEYASISKPKPSRRY
ncbi:IGSF9B [Branchiostoma lanceolatum]|uniref:IGSF9B protein n=1 Tax=Branchiostoma lanceolatum TaxID=7740 RepID=A0A8K0EFR5_BRALA|nr:IGSF9B [Branchiostoma lanceolatum]